MSDSSLPTPPAEDREERFEEIEYWWSGGFPGAFAADFRTAPIEPRLFAAFTRVLLAMSPDEYEEFMHLGPTIVCQPGVDGTAFRYSVRVSPGEKVAPLHVLYFAPDLRKWSDDRLASLVAHEVAHMMLGHWGGLEVGAGDMHGEEAAERLAESWGFKGAYSKAHRRRLAARHAAAKERSR